MDPSENPRAGKTFLDNWVEPALPPPAPSFTDYPNLHIERYGVLETMAPLGTLPSSRVKRMAKTEPPRKSLVAKKAEDSDASTPAHTPREMVTPEPQTNATRRRSDSRNVDEAEGNANPKTPIAQTSPRKSPTKTGPSVDGNARLSQSPYVAKEDRALASTDRAVQFAVEDAILNHRWPTAYALRTLYNDHKINPRIRRLFMSIFTSQATPEEQKEFQSLMTYKKKEGAKDFKAQRYFDEHDNVYAPANLFQASWSLSAASKRASAEATSRASTSPHKEAAHVSKKAKVNHVRHSSGHHHSNHIHLTISSDKPAEMNGHAKSKIQQEHQIQNGAVSVPAPVVTTRSRSVSSSSSLSSLDEALLEDERAFAAQREITEAKRVRAEELSTREEPTLEPTLSAEKAARNQSKRHQPITRHKAHVHKVHTFTAVNSTSSSNTPSATSSTTNIQQNGDVMRSHSVETYTLPPALPTLPPQLVLSRSHKKGAAAALRRLTSITPRDEEIIRRKKEAKIKTDTTIAPKPSFVRTPVQVPEPESESEAGDTIAVAAQPPVRQVLRFRRRGGGDESDNFSSPTRLSFQPDLAPGSSRNSRANTPNASTRPSRKAKNSGPRMKSSPKKNPYGPSGGIPRASGQRDSPTGGAHNQDENDDYCSSCGGNGDLVCCDGCTRSFHLRCVDPPMIEGKLPDEWYCNVCLSRREPTRPCYGGVFGELIPLLESKNPVAFHLPKDIREYFEGVRTGVEGEYEEGPPPKKKHDEQIDYLRLKDNKGNPILCHACAGGSGGTRPIVPCSFCGLNWHLDCLDPPLANPPPNSIHRPWKCPCHIDELLGLVPDSLGPAHRFRRIKGKSVIKPAITRGVINSGHIEVELTPSDDEKDAGFFEEKEYGRVYKLPEEGIKLDFISRVHAKRRAASRLQSPYSVPSIPALPSAPSAPVPFSKRTLDDQQAVLNLEYLAAQADGADADSTNVLINALISEASPAVIDLVARGSVSGAVGRKMSKVELAALRAMRGWLGAIVERAEGEGEGMEIDGEGEVKLEQEQEQGLESGSEAGRKRKREPAEDEGVEEN